MGVNGHSVHPVYVETRYGNVSSLSQGIYARGAHVQAWMMHDMTITYRTIRGRLDLYFFSRPTVQEFSRHHICQLAGFLASADPSR